VQSAEDAFRDLSQPDFGLSGHAKKQESIRAWLLQFDNLLENNEAEYLSEAPPQHGLECIVAEYTEKVSEWLNNILRTTDPWLLRHRMMTSSARPSYRICAAPAVSPE
jgi:hypothetical protein